MADYFKSSNVVEIQNVFEKGETYGGPESSDISYLLSKEKEKKQDTLIEDSSLKAQEIDFDQPSEEDEVRSFNSFLKNKGFVTNEYWKPSLHVGGRIVEIGEQQVVVECLINKQKKIFQIRKFSRVLFEELFPLNEGDLVLIRIRLKAGSQRIDIFDAKGMSGVKKEDFDYAGDWDGIDESLSKPLPNRW